MRDLLNSLWRFGAATIVVVAALAGCLSESPVGNPGTGGPGGDNNPTVTDNPGGGGGGGTEIPNELWGRLYAVSGAPAVAAHVTLIPVGYVPDSGAAQGGAGADTLRGLFRTVTDSTGGYAFTGVPDGRYNVLFEKSGVGSAAFRDSVLVTGGTATVPGDTLRAPGIVNAVVNLSPADAQRLVTVQVVGTTVFRRGRAADGVAVDLPQGRFDLRVSVDIPAVQPVVETIDVTAGESETLPVTFPTYLFPVIW